MCRRAQAMPLMAALLDSVPPLVNMISSGLAKEQRGHLGTGAFHSVSGLQPITMGAGGVAEPFAQVRLHGCDHLRVKGCGRVVIQVNRSFSHIQSLSWAKLAAFPKNRNPVEGRVIAAPA